MTPTTVSTAAQLQSGPNAPAGRLHGTLSERHASGSRPRAQAFNASKYSLCSPDADGSFNRSQDILKAWSTTNTGSNIPIISKADNNGNFSTPSTWYLESASYLRLKNLTIAYDLTSLLRKSGHFRERGSNLSVALCGENLFTITPYSGIDPECGGYDALKYPVSRTFSLSVKLTY